MVQTALQDEARTGSPTVRDGGRGQRTGRVGAPHLMAISSTARGGQPGHAFKQEMILFKQVEILCNLSLTASAIRAAPVPSEVGTSGA